MSTKNFYIMFPLEVRKTLYNMDADPDGVDPNPTLKRTLDQNPTLDLKLQLFPFDIFNIINTSLG